MEKARFYNGNPIHTEPEQWPTQDELPETDISDIEATYRATVDSEAE